MQNGVLPMQMSPLTLVAASAANGHPFEANIRSAPPLMCVLQPGVANVYCAVVQQSRGSASLVIADAAHSHFPGWTYRCDS